FRLASYLLSFSYLLKISSLTFLAKLISLILNKALTSALNSSVFFFGDFSNIFLIKCAWHLCQETFVKDSFIALTKPLCGSLITILSPDIPLFFKYSKKLDQLLTVSP
ncbi:MAG: hypothetical protein MR512_04520, partial [Anaerococcus sp.]|nr:hypothetical protein [Anaerococcus sp.]